MASNTSWEFHKENQEKILWIHICTKDFSEVIISINKWSKTRYPEYKIRLVSKNEFKKIKLIQQQKDQ